MSIMLGLVLVGWFTMSVDGAVILISEKKKDEKTELKESALNAFGQTIEVSPKDGLVDQRLMIRVFGLKAGQPVIIRASMKDIDGNPWQSHAGFYADEKGVIDLSKQAPANGDYSGVDPMGLIRSVTLPLGNCKTTRFRYDSSKPLLTTFTLEVNGQKVDSIKITRHFRSQNIKVQAVQSDGLVGKLFLPSKNRKYPGLIVLGGSEGGLSSVDHAMLLASHGYASLALAYFGVDGLPDALEEIPLEYFVKAVDWMESQTFLKKGSLGIVGTSKGAEAALIISAMDSRIRAVVAYVPSSAAWSCICSDSNKSSWSLGGKSVPFVAFQPDPTYRPLRNYPIRASINYRYRLKNQQAVQRALIKVEKINGPILLISGKDDQLWPSFEMSEMIMDRLRQHNHLFEFRHLYYENAGHKILKAYLPMAGSTTAARGRLILGGTDEGNARAQEDSWPKVLAFLEAAFADK